MDAASEHPDCQQCGQPMQWGPTPLAGPFPQYGRWRHTVDPDDDHDVVMPAGWGDDAGD